MKTNYEYQAKVIRVLDGDTVEVHVDLGFSSTMRMKIRVIAKSTAGFDTPETWRPEDEEERVLGQAATDRAKELLEDKTILLRSVKYGKYRYVATIELADGLDFGDIMISEGHQKKVRKISPEWLRIIPEEYGISISGYDGWIVDGVNHFFNEELITEEEFKKRLMDSVVSSKRGGFEKYIKSDNA